MHIPQSDTSCLEILSYREACEKSTSDSYDRERWLYVPDFYTAEPDNLDPTLKSVSRIADTNGYDSWLMFNVYAQRATRPDDMDPVRNEQLHRENMEAFRALLERAASCGGRPVVWAAWGAIIEKRAWLTDCVRDMRKAAEEYGADWVCAGNCSKRGHPHHPLYLRKDERFHPFDIGGYLA